MTKITKCLNDWNATIEALGNKEQTIILRKTSTTQKDFLLDPTVSYAKKDNVLYSFRINIKILLRIIFFQMVRMESMKLNIMQL